MKKSLILSVTLILSLLSSCKSSAQPEPVEVTPSRTVTATEDVIATRTAEAIIKETANAATEIASNTTATVVQATEESLQTLQAQETATSVSGTQRAQRTATLEARSLQYTQTALPLLTLVEELHNDGIINSTTGIYSQLKDYEDTWAQINWYRRMPIYYSINNFVIKADIEYESASRTANWFSSGCGFAFREDNSGDHYHVFAALDGYVYINAIRYDQYVYLGKGYYGNASIPTGNLEMVLVVEDDWIHVYVDGEKSLSVQNIWFTKGRLSYSLTSGTNKDFGTNCKFSNVELWKLTSE